MAVDFAMPNSSLLLPPATELSHCFCVPVVTAG